MFLLALSWLFSDMWQVKWHCLSISVKNPPAAVYKASVVRPVANRKNKVLLRYCTFDINFPLH